MNLATIYPSKGSSNSDVANSNIINITGIDQVFNTVVADELYDYIEEQGNDKIILQTSHGDKVSIRIEPDFSYATLFSFLFLAVFLLAVIGFALKDLNKDNHNKKNNDELLEYYKNENFRLKQEVLQWEEYYKSQNEFKK